MVSRPSHLYPRWLLPSLIAKNSSSDRLFALDVLLSQRLSAPCSSKAHKPRRLAAKQRGTPAQLRAASLTQRPSCARSLESFRAPRRQQRERNVINLRAAAHQTRTPPHPPNAGCRILDQGESHVFEHKCITNRVLQSAKAADTRRQTERNSSDAFAASSPLRPSYALSPQV
jgi:hypothetical protein